MKTKLLFSTVASLAVMTIFGCGGGGGTPAAPTPPAGSTTISGALVKGPVSGAKISIFDVRADGTVDRSTVLGQADTTADGKYQITLTKLPTAGPIVLEAIGGTYTDEVSGKAGVTLKATLRTAVPGIANGDSIAITPLTEIAYHKTEGLQLPAATAGSAAGAGAFTPANIKDSNLTIGKTFKVDDIIKSKPFDATKAAPAGVSADDQRYAAALGIFSQMVNDDMKKNATTITTLDDALPHLITQLEDEVHNHGCFLPATFASLSKANDEFTLLNKGGIVPAAGALTPTASVLTLTATATLKPGEVINSLDFMLTLPAGVSLKPAKFNAVSGETIAGVLQPSSIAATNSFAVGKYTPSTATTPATLRITLLNVQPGIVPTQQTPEFMHVNFDGFPTSGAFAVSAITANGGADPKATPTALTVGIPIPADGSDIAGL